MGAELPREISFNEVLVGDRVEHLGRDAVVRDIRRNGGGIRLECGDQPAHWGQQGDRLTLIERPAQAAIQCGEQGCGRDAVVSFVFQSSDGHALSEHWNRCWDHATVPLPEMAPEGSAVTITAPRS